MKKFSSFILLILHLSQVFALVNINTAGLVELETVKGVGAKKAQAIIKYRLSHQRFNSIYELTHIRGFSYKSVSSIANQIEAK